MQRRMFGQHNQVQQASWLSEHDIVDVAHSINFGMRLQRKQRAKVAINTKKRQTKRLICRKGATVRGVRGIDSQCA